MCSREVATKGVLDDACAEGYRERSGMADGGAGVPEVLSAVELEGFFAGFVPEPLEPRIMRVNDLGSRPGLLR